MTDNTKANEARLANLAKGRAALKRKREALAKEKENENNKEKDMDLMTNMILNTNKKIKKLKKKVKKTHQEKYDDPYEYPYPSLYERRSLPKEEEPKFNWQFFKQGAMFIGFSLFTLAGAYFKQQSQGKPVEKDDDDHADPKPINLFR